MKQALLIIVGLLMITGCGKYSQTVQVSDDAYLLLIGDTTGYVVVIDNDSPIDLENDTTSFGLNGKTATKIKILTGTHTLKVTKNGNVTINRKFFVSTGTSFEVNL